MVEISVGGVVVPGDNVRQLTDKDQQQVRGGGVATDYIFAPMYDDCPC